MTIGRLTCLLTGVYGYPITGSILTKIGANPIQKLEVGGEKLEAPNASDTT
jgi:hypothetical protein